MPTIDDYRNKYPSLKALDDSALIDRVAEVQGVSRDDVMAHMGYKPKSRGILSVLNDTVIEGANAVAGGVKSVGDFVAPGNPVSEFIDTNIIKAGEAKQSDVVKAEKARYRDEMEGAQGIGDEVGATLGYVARNPVQSLAQAAGSFVLPGAAVKGGGMLASMAGAGAKGATRAGLAGGAGAGAALSGGDAAGTAYELVKKAGGTDEQATEAARKASVLPAAIGAAGGVVGAERLLAGAKGFGGNAASRALKTAGVEGAQEAVEEGVTQYEGQAAAAPYDPTIDPMKGVAGAATMGAALGAATGGGVSLLSGEPRDLVPKKPGVGDVLAAPSVDDAINAAKEAVGAKPAQRAQAPAELPQMDPDDRREVLGLLQVVNRPGVSPNVARFAQSRMDALLAPYRTIPAGEATEMLPVPDARELTDEERAEYVNAVPFSYRWAVQRGLPQPEVTELLPTGDATEVEPIPAADAFEELPAPEAYEVAPVGEASELLPTPDVAEYDQVPAGEASELDAETIQADDLLARDGEPFTSKTGAQAKAYASGGGQVVAIPDHFGSGQPGYVVRPLVQARPNNTRGTNAGDVARTAGQRADDAGRGDGTAGVPDQRPGNVLASPAAAAGQGVAGPGTAGGGTAAPDALSNNGFIPGPNGYKVRVSRHQRGSNVLDPGADVGAFVYEVRKGDGDSNPLTMVVNKDGKFVEAGTVLTNNQSNGTAWVPKSQAAADTVQALLEQRAGTEVGSAARKAIDAKIAEAVAADQAGPTGGAAGPALTEGQRVNLAGKSYTVVSATPAAVKLDDGAGNTRMVARNSKTFGQIQAATGNPMLDNPASWVIREKATGKVVMETFDRAKVDALNTAKYEAVPAAQYLGELNGKPQEPNEAARPNAQAAGAEAAAPAAAPAPAAPALVPRTGPADAQAGGVNAAPGTYTVPDAIGADGPAPETVRLVVRPDGTAVIIRENGDLIDVTNMVRAGFTAERAIAQSIGDDTSGANVTQDGSKPPATNAPAPVEAGSGSAAPAPAAVAPEAERYAAGRALTKEQRKQVLGTLVDVYKAKGADREMKGQGRDGNERYGYVHSPELFEKSDITGAMVRYYVTLPDGKRAHPTELFPDYTQADVDAALAKREADEKADRENQAGAEARADKFAAPTVAAAEASWKERNKGMAGADPLRDWRTGHRYTLVTLEKGGQFYSVRNDDAALMSRLERGGWKRSDVSTSAPNLNTSPERVQKAPENEQVAPTPKAQAVKEALARKGGRTLQEKVERPATADEVVATAGQADAEGERKFYVTMVRGDRVARLAGPFDTKAEADAILPRARDEANKADPRSAFDAFGVSGITSTNHRPGTLNERLGIGEAPAEARQAPGAAPADTLPKPWEISQDEFVRRATFTKEGSTAYPWVAKWGDTILEAQNEEFDHPDLGKTIVQGGRFAKTKKEAETIARGAHKRAVRRGVLNGNTATPEALAAYPDLQPAKPAAAPAAAPKAEQAPAEQATAILNAAAEPPKGKERLDVLKDVKAGAITPEEVAAAYPAATTGTESLNKRHAIAKKQVLTSGGALKADATNSRADSAVWYYQGDMDALRFTASVKVDGRADPRADDAKRMLVQIKAAQDAGWRRANYRAGSLGTVWVFQRGDEFLTRAGMENAAAVEVQRPVLSEDRTGYAAMATQQFELARAFNDWLLTLPEDQQDNRGVVVRKMGETPVGDWARVEDDIGGGVALRYYEKDAPQFRIGFGARNWPELRAYVRELASRFDQSRGADENALYTLVNDAARAANAAEPGSTVPAGWVFAAGRRFTGSVDAEVAQLNADKDGNEYREFRGGIIQRPAERSASAAPAAPSVPATPTEADAALWKKITAGEATPDEFKAGFDAWVANKAAILAELNGKTRADLLKIGGAWFTSRYKGDTKPEIAEALWRDGASAYTLGRSFQYGMGKDSHTNGIRKMVEATDADQLAQYVADRKAAQEEAMARVAKMAEAIKDPKTLGDYNTWMRATMEGGKTSTEARMMLTPEQRAAYDELAADSTRSSRKVKQDTERTTVRAAGQTTAGEVIATKHTRDGHDLWVVKLADRVSKDDYITLLASAKRLGGNYSSFRGNGAVPGFQFRTPDAAQAFLKLAGGDTAQATEVAQERRNAFEDDRSQSAAERLTEMADRLEERADESLGRDRKANTDRRARFAAAAEAAASADKAMAKTMRNIASAITGGGAKFLDRVRQKVQVELLQTYVANAKSDELRAKYPSYTEQERHKGERPTFETADYAEFPTFTAYRSDLASLGRQLLEVDGTKKMGERIMKVADDVSDAFTAFAKEPGSLFRLSAFSVRAGDEVRTAIFPTREGAERAITRSGLSGKAIVFPEKRGVNRIIMSPSEAMARGIWKGDGDKRITLDPDFAGELVEKIGRVARRGAKVSVPWQFERAYDRRKQLSRMGIESPAEFRAALREFIAMREQPAEADKIKAMERAMVGRRNDGLDFFPTPEGVADEMVAAADIQPGMRVLEPSAGMGHIAERIRATEVDPDVVEFSNDRRELLEAKGFNVVARDFMDLTEGGYDRILMNPPFSDGRDIQHVRHAYDLLKPGGRLVAIMGESAFFNQNKRATEFREWLESVGGTDEKLPEGTFNDPSLPVTTGANARMVVIEKPAGETGPRSIINGPGADALFSRAPGRSVELEAADAVGREFWRKIDNGESFTNQEVLDALSINRRGSRRVARGMVAPADIAGVGIAPIEWQGDLASFGAYTSRASWDGDNFNVFFAPNSIAQGADLSDYAQARDRALVHVSFRLADDGRYEISYNDPPAASTALLAAEKAGVAAKAGTAANEYRRIDLDAGDVQSREITQEAIRRLALNIGQTPAVFYPRRETGARAGQENTGRGRDQDYVRNKFSRAQPSRTGVPMADAKAVVATIREALPTAPDIVLHDSVRRAPENLRRLIRQAGADNDVEAVYHDGEIHVFPGNIASIERMQFVVAHHEVRHHGLRSMLGPQMGPAMLRMYASNANLKAAADAKMAAGLADTRILAVEEALADMPVEELKALTGWARIVAAARQWLRQAAAKLRRAGLNTLADAMEPEGWTDNDIAALVQRAEDVSRGGAAPFRTGGTVFGREDNPDWYSALADQVGKASMNAGPATAWKSLLKNWISTGKVKADEVEWSGLNDWLAIQQGKVARQQVADYLQANGVQVTETVLGAQAYIVDAAKEVIVAHDDLGYDSTAQAMGAMRRDFNRSADADKVLDNYSFDAPSDRRAVQRWLEANDLDEDRTKYGQYTLPGGSNYREVLLTLPGKAEKTFDEWLDEKGIDPAPEAEPALRERWQADMREGGSTQYRSGHWDQPNILAHVRLNDRVDASGARTLFVEELQSDWGQQRKKNLKMAAESGSQMVREGVDKQTPPAPFIDSTDKWVSLALKRVIKMAVDGGYDKVAFITGEQSAERYDLSKHVEELMIERHGDNFSIAMKPMGRGYGEGSRWSGKTGELPDAVGKEMADKVAAQPQGRSYLRGLDLKIGGEGMRAFYDRIVPAVAKDVLRKLGGGAMETVQINGAATYDQLVEAGKRSGKTQAELDAMPVAERKALIDSMLPKQPSFTITQAMRDKALGGMPLFSRADQTQTPDARPQAVRAVQTMPRSPLTGRPVFDLMDAAGNRIETQHHAKTADEALENYRERPARQAAARAAAPAPTYAMPEKAAKAEGSNWRRVRGQEFTSLDEDDGYLYHVTSAPAAAGVREQGLVPNAGGMFGGFYANYSAGKVFLTERSGVSYWQEKVGQQLEAAMENPPAVMVLRIPKDKIKAKLLPDTVGSGDARAPAFYSNEAVFSRAGTAKTTAQDLVNSTGGVFDFNRLGETKQDRLRTIMDAGRPGWLGLLTRDQIADVYGQEIAPVKEYDQLTREMENQRSKIAQDADDLYNEWAKLPAETNDKLARLMLDATVYSVHPDGAFTKLGKPNDAERQQVHARLKAQYALMGKDGQAIYGKVRDFHKGTLEQLRDALEARVTRQVENGQAKAAALTKIRQAFDAYLKEGPYFPLSRFGDFIVVGTRDADGERVVASYATAGEQAAAARTLEADGFTVKMKTAKTYSRETDGSAGKFIGDVLTTIGNLDMLDATVGGDVAGLQAKLMDDVNQLFIKALPDLSYRQHFMHRKGTPGFSSDMMRGFASSAFHAASHIARLNHGDRMTFALQDAFTAIEQAPAGDFNLHSQVLNELTKRHDAALNPNTHPVAAMLNQVGFVMYLGLSPAAGLINMLQTVMVTMPHLGARYGFGKANASLATALTDITTGAKANAKNGWNAAQSTKLTAAERTMMSELQDEGVIDLTQAHDLSAATGLDTGNVARSKAAFAMARAMKIVGWTFHIPEVMNRQVTALSAYRLEMEKSGNEDAARDAAREAIKRTHFDYGSSNRARFMQGNVARVLLQFKQYAQNMTYLLGRAAYQALKDESPEVRSIARRQLVATFGVTWAMAGALGLPGLGAVAGLIGMLVGAMDDDDEPYDWKVEFRNLLADNFGKEAGEVLSHGIPRALLPWDISNRVSLGDLWFRDSGREGQSPREAFATDAANILGPTAGTVLGLYTAADHMARGNWSKAAESVLPKFLRDPLKAIREGSDGVTSYNGEPLMDLTGAEVTGRLLGFAPARASEMYEGKAAVMNAKTAIEEKRQSLISRMAKARIDKDTDTAAELQPEIAAFNERNPEFKITGATLAKAIMTRMRNRRNTEDGILLPRTKDSLRELGRFAEVD